jgi:APA family basic amino acid/polyamine antiporter
MFAMSEDGILPPVFAKRHSTTGALTVSLTAFTVVSLITVFWAGEFDRILSFSIFLDCFGMILSAATIFILRRKTKHLDGTGIFKMKLYPVLPAIFIAAYVFVAISISTDYRSNHYAALTGIIVLTCFVALYFLIHGRKKQNLE